MVWAPHLTTGCQERFSFAEHIAEVKALQSDVNALLQLLQLLQLLSI